MQERCYASPGLKPFVQVAKLCRQLLLPAHDLLPDSAWAHAASCSDLLHVSAHIAGQVVAAASVMYTQQGEEYAQVHVQVGRMSFGQEHTARCSQWFKSDVHVRPCYNSLFGGEVCGGEHLSTHSPVIQVLLALLYAAGLGQLQRRRAQRADL